MVKALVVTGMLLSVCAWGWAGWKDVSDAVLSASPSHTVYLRDLSVAGGDPSLNSQIDTLSGAFAEAFASDTTCHGVRLIREVNNPTVPDSMHWRLSVLPKGDIFDTLTRPVGNWSLYHSDNANLGVDMAGKTSSEAAHQVCEIVRGNGGSIQ